MLLRQISRRAAAQNIIRHWIHILTSKYDPDSHYIHPVPFPQGRIIPFAVKCRNGGRGRFSERSASPPDPLSRRVAGNRLVRSFELVCPCSVGMSPISLVVAAAWRTNPFARCRRAPPLSGEAWQETRQKAPSAEGSVRGSLFRLRNSEVALATGVFNPRLNTPPFR